MAVLREPRNESFSEASNMATLAKELESCLTFRVHMDFVAAGGSKSSASMRVMYKLPTLVKYPSSCIVYNYSHKNDHADLSRPRGM